MFPPQQRTLDLDASIRSTDSDAAVARLSAVQKLYFTDPFIRHLVPRAHLQQPRPPLINIGTYVRSTGIDALVDEWLELARKTGQKCQIISLGSGSDTRFWRIATGPYNDDLATYIEMDFPEITSKKAMSIRKSKDLSTVLGGPSDVKLSNGGTALHSPRYHLMPVDLRLSPAEALGPLLASDPLNDYAILSPSLPTLLLFECVLVYMSPEASSRLLEWFVTYFSTSSSESGVLGCVIYEMFKLNDAFGRVMVANLSSRNVSIPGAEPFTTLEGLSDRFLNAGFTAARALTLREIRRAYINASELERIAKLEFLDEVEELDLVLEHYAISWGLHLPNPAALSSTWGHWGLKGKQT